MGKAKRPPKYQPKKPQPNPQPLPSPPPSPKSRPTKGKSSKYTTPAPAPKAPKPKPTPQHLPDYNPAVHIGRHNLNASQLAKRETMVAHLEASPLGKLGAGPNPIPEPDRWEKESRHVRMAMGARMRKGWEKN
jgi:hypothetical protein